MDCLDENTVLDLVTGIAPLATRDAVQAHIDTCDDCRALLAEMAKSTPADPRELEPPPDSPPRPRKLRTGDVIGDRYELGRVLGAGGMGMVWAARDRVEQRDVAVKVARLTTEEARQRFVREASIALRLEHPGIVAVYDIGEQPPSIVMELLEGETLEQRLRREERLAPQDIAPLMLPILDALSAAHAQGIVHRDLKPQNVFLARGGVKVLDFGVAKVKEAEAGITRSGAVLGTPHYMAPEQIFGEKDIDERADLWAVGVILYRAVTGSLPVPGDSFGEIFKALTMGSIAPMQGPMAPLVMRLLSRERSGRPSHAAEVASALARFV